MNIREGALTSSQDQEKIIRDFLTSVHNTIEQVILQHERVSIPVMKKLLQPFQNKNLSLTPSVKLTSKFVFREHGNDSGWIEEITINKHYGLVMNMTEFIITENMTDVTDVRWNRFYSVFIHEYKHFLQTIKAGGKNFDSSDNVDYWDRPDEQQANAEEYLELLKHQLQTTDPVTILNYLKTHELSDSGTLYGLKQKNPAAWKNIMKQTFLAVVRDLNQT